MTTARGSEQELMPALYVVATPIGNLRDITLRALEVLRQADWIAAEDTRVTRKLLAQHGITVPLRSVRAHNERAAAEKIVADLARGKRIALVTDAGTPGVSDPGARVVASVRAAGFPVVPIPGASALAAALSVAGLPMDHFLFYGFLPARAGERRAVIDELATLPYALVFFEAPHRILAVVNDLAARLKGSRPLVVARELTKRFESVASLTVAEAPAWFEADRDRCRGEFVLIVGPQAAKPHADVERVLRVLLEVLPMSQAARVAASLTGLPRSQLYALARTLGA